MITDIIIKIFYNVLSFFVGFLPTGSYDSSISTGLAGFFHSVYQYNNIFPMDTAFFLIQITIYFWSIIFIWDFIKWLLHYFRGN